MAIKFVDDKPTKPTRETRAKSKPVVLSVVPKRKGRPLASQAHLAIEQQKPWEALGMSRRTWYRRQKEKK